MRRLFKLLPQFLRDSIYRRNVPLQNYEKRSEGVTIKLATTREDLEAAYRLLHDVYVASGLMDPDPSGLRVNLYSSLPYTSVVIAKIKDQVVGTVSLIKDSPIGIPSDVDYRDENSAYRLKGLRLVEVSALAVDKAHRKNAQGSLISFLLMRFLWQYTMKRMGADVLVAIVHPRARDFYRALFNFKQNGKIIEYKSVKKALATHLTSELVLVEPFVQQGPLLYDFFTNPLPQNLDFPKLANGLVLHPVMTPELLDYFFIQRTDLFQQLSIHQLELIKNAYELHFSLDQIELFKFIKGRRFGFRYQSEIKGMLAINDRFVECQVFDLSPSGAFVQTLESGTVGEHVSLVLSVDSHLHTIEGKVIRINNDHTRYYPRGFAIKFLEESKEVIQAITSSHLNKKTS